MTRRIGVLGTLVWDTNWHPAVAAPGAPLEQWGGAVYSLTALSASCPPGWLVEPIIKVGADLYAAARLELGSYPSLRLGPGLRTVPEPNNRVELRYVDVTHRDEILRGGVPAWTAVELEPIIREQDALYINFLSGSELELETAMQVRRLFGGPIYSDLHSLFLAPPSTGPRVPRPLPAWQKWVGCFDVIQLNETELALLAGDRDEDELFAEILEIGPLLVVVTLGARGVRYVARTGRSNGRLRLVDVPSGGGDGSGYVLPPFGALEGDPTGCGDVFGATLFAGLLAGLPIQRAIDRAQTLAAVKMRHPDTRTLRQEFEQALR